MIVTRDYRLTNEIINLYKQIIWEVFTLSTYLVEFIDKLNTDTAMLSWRFPVSGYSYFL